MAQRRAGGPASGLRHILFRDLPLRLRSKMNTFLLTIYAVLVTLFAVILFVWALRSGQFKDQRRAGYLPLARQNGGESADRPAMSRRWRLLHGFVGALAVLLLATVFFLVYAAFQNG